MITSQYKDTLRKIINAFYKSKNPSGLVVTNRGVKDSNFTGENVTIIVLKEGRELDDSEKLSFQRLAEVIVQERVEPVETKKETHGLTTDNTDLELSELAEDGQYKKHIVLSEEERSKGFIRTVRNEYEHKGREFDKTLMNKLEEPVVHSNKKYTHQVGIRIDGEVKGHRLLQEDEAAQLEETGHVGGCGVVTSMPKSIAETYARDPKFYGSTYCVGCKVYLPVTEFVWKNTDEKVGS